MVKCNIYWTGTDLLKGKVWKNGVIAAAIIYWEPALCEALC